MEVCRRNGLPAKIALEMPFLGFGNRDFPETGAKHACEAVTTRENTTLIFLSLRLVRCSFDGRRWQDLNGLPTAAT